MVVKMRLGGKEARRRVELGGDEEGGDLFVPHKQSSARHANSPEHKYIHF